MFHLLRDQSLLQKMISRISALRSWYCSTWFLRQLRLFSSCDFFPPVDDDNDGSKKRILVIDPTSGRGFVCSTDQTAKGRPEYIFLDTLGDQNVMVSCSKIVTDYDRANEAPANLEVINKDPFNEGQNLSFVVRTVSNNDPNQHDRIKLGLQQFFLQREAPHGFIVLIPNLCDQEFATWWGRGTLKPPTEHTNDNLDKWILTIIRNEARAVMQLQQMLAQAQGR